MQPLTKSLEILMIMCKLKISNAPPQQFFSNVENCRREINSSTQEKTLSMSHLKIPISKVYYSVKTLKSDDVNSINY
jgi:hypothetical protein